ncbi:MAG: DnaB-like helicase C-terminal domain-containing protein, partial [bacterium]
MNDKSQIKVPTHSDEAEESVLGALLLDKDAVIAVAEFLRPDDFYDERKKEIFECCLGLYEERIPVDVMTVSNRLKKRKALKRVGGASYLAGLANKVPTAAHVEHYGKIVKDAATKRSIMSAASKLVEMSFDDSLMADEVLDKAETEIFSLSQRHLARAFTPVKSALAESFDRLDELHKQGEGLRGMPTGFKDLDDSLAGMQKSNLLILASRPGVGKCVAGDTLIINPDTGECRTIQSVVLEKKGKVVVLNEKLGLEKATPSVFVDDGKKPVYEIKTALGNRLEATAVHPLLTIEGWRKVEELRRGVRIAVPRKLECFGKKRWEDYRLKSLAYFLGDGGVTGSVPKFTNNNPIVLADFCDSVKKFGQVKTKYVKQSPKRFRTPSIVVVKVDPYQKGSRKDFSGRVKKWLLETGWTQRKLALTLKVSPSLVNMWIKGTSLPGPLTYMKLEKLFGGKVEKTDRFNPVTVWLSEFGIMGKLSINKEIPAEIFELKKKNIGLFLNRLFACEGSAMVSKGKGVGRISFASSSSKMAEQVKHLLLRFGVLAKLRSKNVRYKGEIKRAYKVEILGAEDILMFIREIGIFAKERKLKELEKIAKRKKTAKNWTKDTLPLEIWKLVLEEKGNLSWRDVYRRMHRPLSHNVHVNKRQLRRETLKEIAIALNSRKLLHLATSDVYWDRIVSIKPSGTKQVYDLTIGKLHNFVANDIVVHNTSLALNIAQNLAVKHKRPVGFFSLEMSKEELVDRLLVAQADIDAWKLKTGKLGEDDFTKLSNAMGELAEAPLFIDDTPALSIMEMRTKARRLQVESGVDLLIVDYLQL